MSKEKDDRLKLTGKSLVDLDKVLTMLHNRYTMDRLEIEVTRLHSGDIGWAVKARPQN